MPRSERNRVRLARSAAVIKSTYFALRVRLLDQISRPDKQVAALVWRQVLQSRYVRIPLARQLFRARPAINASVNLSNVRFRGFDCHFLPTLATLVEHEPDVRHFQH